MKARSVLLVSVIAVTVFSFSLLGYLFGVSVSHKDNIPLNPPQTAQKATTVRTEVAKAAENEEDFSGNIKEKFILREKNGEIALLKKGTDGKETLLNSYDVPISFLPKDDRETLRKGLEFNSLDEIVMFIEDYIG